MTDYPLIEKFLKGLKQNSGIFEEYVKKSDLEAELANGVQVYGLRDMNTTALVSLQNFPHDTHTALLLVS